ncbi:amino acid aminotransferase [Thermomonas sp.]|jgi:aspartate/tyrosine/aromatic aminotransferase|uniref:amino acid aminotransferase n=1 Tax=Thermomonas sp. TaxID=1971895 RepID=UPI001B64D47E|nr:amino acid aminotransferase [Thermomonas sp.]MBK6925054.1 aspartate/tyrosine/aromatic aminotransferase [Thermomonas sp.]MBK7205596.1 aspartate/tyrosine/aromatic aminotransferase [Thermomonas sp.]MBK9670623.1 aspartate/tyrosine/aromatic aminotransferase [Thermomonas sp.]MBL0227741.1 aspartate/tyrosine/aromatic aminotransferase [Thermomonas sp.]MBP7157511.1 aspartate/tyrosine/aromatic aminotransferase [Thermomonas sp.]
MFETLQAAAADPILGLMARFREDQRAHKVDLGVGVYRDPSGRTPVMRAVHAAERLRLEEEDSKSYQGMLGDVAFDAAIQSLCFGPSEAGIADRLATVHTPGGTAALRTAADLVRAARPDARVWLADPSWDNHAPIFRAAGLEVRDYPYLDPARSGLRSAELLETLETVPAGDAVLFQASCHNPSGVDIDAATWERIAEIAGRRGFLPILDMAYQGLGDGLDADAAGLRLLAAQLPEMLLTSSCSKNFGLYRERIGAVSVLAASAEHTRVAMSVLLRGIRANYSMPPAHGAAVVARVLARPDLRADWEQELAGMRVHVAGMRDRLATTLAGLGCPREALRRQRGMFSFVNLPADGARRLREEHAIYVLESGRINLAGLNDDSAVRFAHALQAVGFTGD